MTWKRFIWGVRWRCAVVVLVWVAWIVLPHPPGLAYALGRVLAALLWGPLLARYFAFYRDMGEVEKLLRIQGFFDD